MVIKDRKPKKFRRVRRLRPAPKDHFDEFAPTPEAEFKHVLEYTERQRFKFKLSKWQCRDLVEAMCRHDAKLRAKRLSDELSLGRP